MQLLALAQRSTTFPQSLGHVDRVNRACSKLYVYERGLEVFDRCPCLDWTDAVKVR
jgi:hypothetical protein